MPTQLIQLGVPTVLAAGVTYALPARKCFVQSLTAVDVSLDNSTFAALTGSNTTGAATSAPYVRSTGGTTIVAKADA